MLLCRVRHIFAEVCIFSCVKLDISAQMCNVGVDVCVICDKLEVRVKVKKKNDKIERW